MSRLTKGTLLAAGLSIILGLTLASAVAWGPHSCGLVIIKVIGCAIGSYESLSGGLLAADAAIFAGWLAWSAVQVTIAAKGRRARRNREEAELELQGDLTVIAPVRLAGSIRSPRPLPFGPIDWPRLAGFERSSLDYRDLESAEYSAQPQRALARENAVHLRPLPAYFGLKERYPQNFTKE